MSVVRWCSFIVFMACTALASAAELELQTYPHARVIFESNAATEEYLLALGSYKKVAGAWRLDRMQRLSGMLQRFTLELPETHSARNGFDFYVKQLQNFNARELFYCRGRDCGTSNSWANNHFKILQLYGLDQFQYYGAYEVATNGRNPFYVALYAVQRGNKRVYMQIDVLHVDQQIDLGVASSAESIIKSLELKGYYVFPDLVGEEQGKVAIQIKPAHLQALADVLIQKTDWKIALVGHDYAPVPLAQQQAASQTYADQLKAELQKAGVAAARISTFGLGGLSPAGRGERSARVEVVRLN